MFPGQKPKFEITADDLEILEAKYTIAGYLMATETTRCVMALAKEMLAKRLADTLLEKIPMEVVTLEGAWEGDTEIRVSVTLLKSKALDHIKIRRA